MAENLIRFRLIDRAGGILMMGPWLACFEDILEKLEENLARGSFNAGCCILLIQLASSWARQCSRLASGIPVDSRAPAYLPRRDFLALRVSLAGLRWCRSSGRDQQSQDVRGFGGGESSRFEARRFESEFAFVVGRRGMFCHSSRRGFGIVGGSLVPRP